MKVAMVLRVLSALAILVIAPQGASARTFLVVPGQSIQAVIDSSASGDTVSVAAGAYTECLDLKGKNILLAGAGPGMTILTGAPGDAVVTFRSAETNACVLTGFTITGGEGRSFPSYRVGGGIYIEDAEPTIEGNEIRGNGTSPSGGVSAWAGGGIYCDGDPYGVGWSPVIEGNIIADNHAQVNGGGVYVWLNMSAMIQNNHFTENTTVEGDGGAIAVLVNSGTQTIQRNIIDHNVAGDHGGGIYLASASSPAPTAEVSFNLIWSNQANGESWTTLSGGGIWISGVNSHVFRNTIVGSVASKGGAIAVRNNVPCIIDRNILAFSTSPTNQACELWCDSPTGVVRTGNILWGEPWYPDPACGACESGFTEAGNAHADPRLCDWQSGDMSIASDSPAARDGVAYAGAGEVRAGCLTAVERVTWGRVKAMYGH
jgi:hypothetical protein